MATEPGNLFLSQVDSWVFYTIKDYPTVYSRRLRSRGHAAQVPFSLAEAIGRMRSNIHGISDSLMLCLVNTAGNREALRNGLGHFPPSLFSYLKSPNALSPGSSTVPEWDIAHGLSFVQNYVRLLDDDRHQSRNDSNHQAARLYFLADKQIQSWPLAVWANGNLVHEDDSFGVPIIIVFGSWTKADVALVQRHFGSHDRWDRLSAAREWIFHDLNAIFSNWHYIWRLAVRELRSRSVEVNDEKFSGNVLQRMRRLNRAMATNILLRECLLIQQNSAKEILEHASEQYVVFGGLEQDAAQAGFMFRAVQVEKSIIHDLLIVQGVLEQLQNLMTMIISIEQISSGQSVTRLGLLRFVFLPLSFVAAIFGITTWSIDAKWYPAVALPCLVITVTFAMIIPKMASWWQLQQERYTNSYSASEASIGLPTDLELDYDQGDATEVLRGRSVVRDSDLGIGYPFSRQDQEVPERLRSSSYQRELRQFENSRKNEEYMMTAAASVRSGMLYHSRANSEETIIGIRGARGSSAEEMARRRFVGKFFHKKHQDDVVDQKDTPASTPSAWERLKRLRWRSD